MCAANTGLWACPAGSDLSPCRRRQDFGDTDLYDDVVTAETGDGDSAKTTERSNGSTASKPEPTATFKPSNSRGRRYQLYVGNLTWVRGRSARARV